MTMEPAKFLEAIASGDAETVRSGMPEMANVRHPGGASAVQWAMYHGRRDVADALVLAGARIDLADACTIGDLRAAKSLTDPAEGMASPDELSADGFPPISLAAAFGHNEIVRTLLDRGADPNLLSTALGGVPPLQSAVFGRNLDAVQMLVDAGADVNGRQGGGFTALMGAAQHGDAATVRYLLEKGADRSLADSEGKTAHDYAASDEVRGLLT